MARGRCTSVNALFFLWLMTMCVAGVLGAWGKKPQSFLPDNPLVDQIKVEWSGNPAHLFVSIPSEYKCGEACPGDDECDIGACIIRHFDLDKTGDLSLDEMRFAIADSLNFVERRFADSPEKRMIKMGVPLDKNTTMADIVHSGLSCSELHEIDVYLCKRAEAKEAGLR